MKKIVKRTLLAATGVGVIVAVALIIRKGKLDSYKSKYYTLADMYRSTAATTLGIKNYTEDEEVLLNIKALFKFVLDPVCDKYGTRIKINSGYRTKALNDALFGSSTSQHLTGEAADLDTGSKDGNKKLFEILKQMDFDQLINENDYSWIHVSFKRYGINRKQILTLEQ